MQSQRRANSSTRRQTRVSSLAFLYRNCRNIRSALTSKRYYVVLILSIDTKMRVNDSTYFYYVASQKSKRYKSTIKTIKDNFISLRPHTVVARS